MEQELLKLYTQVLAETMETKNKSINERAISVTLYHIQELMKELKDAKATLALCFSKRAVKRVSRKVGIVYNKLEVQYYILNILKERRTTNEKR